MFAQEAQVTDTERVRRVLEKVPEKRLRIVDLAWQVLDSQGQLDFSKVVAKQREVNLALAEAGAYCKATERAVAALRRLPAKAGT